MKWEALQRLKEIYSPLRLNNAYELSREVYGGYFYYRTGNKSDNKPQQ